MIHWVAYGYVLYNKYMGLPRAAGNRNSTQQKSPGTPRDGSRVLLLNLTFLFWGHLKNLLNWPCCFCPHTMLTEFPLGLLVHQCIGALGVRIGQQKQCTTKKSRDST